MGFQEAADHVWDGIVVGAGPAGAVAAREIARAGAAVLLVDKAIFPRAKVCGCCLNENALGSLEAVGLGDLPLRLGAQPIHTMQLAVERQWAAVPLPGGAALSREVLDAALVEEAIAAGSHFLPQTSAVLEPGQETLRFVTLSQRGATAQMKARVVIAADGLGGTFLEKEPGFDVTLKSDSRIGASAMTFSAPDFYQPGTIFMACGVGGYVGLVHIEEGRLNIAAAFDRAFVKRMGGPGFAAAAVLQEAGFPSIEDLTELPWRGTPALTRHRTRVAGHRLFVIGDAAGYVEPFTGEGMAWALASALAVAPLALEGIRGWDSSLPGRWTAFHRRLIGARQKTCGIITNGLRRPALRRMTVQILNRAPVCAAPVVRAINR